jgi:DNA-binding MarR family transcriptional regulator
VTFLVDRLERRRFVSRARLDGDRRVKALALTAAGVRVRNQLIATVADSPMFARLTRAEQRELAHLLGRCTGENRGGQAAL